jgi:hypothetical protein
VLLRDILNGLARQVHVPSGGDEHEQVVVRVGPILPFTHLGAVRKKLLDPNTDTLATRSRDRVAEETELIAANVGNEMSAMIRFRVIEALLANMAYALPEK